jgi:TonB-linked SusC/RagA family outer membrane protein
MKNHVIGVLCSLYKRHIRKTTPRFDDCRKKTGFMQITLLFICMGVWSASAESYPEINGVTLRIKNGTMLEALQAIENQSDYTFVYNVNDVNLAKSVTLNAENKNLQDVLNLLFGNEEFGYKIIDNRHVALYRKAAVKQQSNVTIRGTVSDESGQPIIGANVVVSGTTIGNVTDMDGKFELSVPQNAVLRITYVGYLQQEVRVTPERTTYAIVMREDTEALEEVVVIGYGSMKKSDVTGSVASVSSEDIIKRNPITLAEGLQGMAAGVQILRNSGAPDGDISIRIRGTATINNDANPIWVVDGVMVGTSASWLNPHDVESIDILKDASATAIYGSRGANGVILVKTKKGQKGRANITISANTGLQTSSSKIKAATASEFATAANIAAKNDALAGSLPVYNPIWTNPDNLTNIDWQDAMSQPAWKKQYNLSATGGTDNMQAMMSVGYLDNRGIIINSYMQRLTARANVNYQVKDFIQAGLNVNVVHSEYSGGGNLFTYASTIPTMDTLDISGSLLHVPIQYADGTWGHFPREGNGFNNKSADNPVAAAMTRDDKSTNNRVLASLNIDISILKELVFRNVLSANIGNTAYNSYAIKHDRTAMPNLTDDLRLNQTSTIEYIMENYLTYDRIWGKHHPTLMIGYSVTKGDGESAGAGAEDFPTPNIRQISLTQSPTTVTASGGLERQNRQQSFFGRLIYSYNDRYILTATVRRDGSSNFGAGNRYGTFPSFSLAWRVTEEDFMKNQHAFSNLKFRAGWGQTGNAGNSTNLSVNQLSSNRIAYYFYDGTSGPFTSLPTIAPGLAQLREIDTNLKWETNESTNIGVDMSFLENALSFTIDWFQRDAKDLLLYKQMRISTGYDNIYTNAGHIRNSGFELMAGYQKHFGDWHLNLKANATTVKNEAVSVGDDIYYSNGPINGSWWDPYSVTRDGYPVGSYFGLKTDGLWQRQSDIDAANAKATANAAASSSALENEIDGPKYYFQPGTAPGDYKYVDIDGNGWVDDQDRTIIGNGYPDFTYGLNVGVSWKNWDFSTYLYGVVGQDILSYAYRNLMSILNPVGQGLQNISSEYAHNAWSGEGSTNKYPRLTRADLNHNGQVSDAYILDGDFLKIQNVQIGYTFPKKWLALLRMESARVYVSLDNLLTISPYKYGDPEVGNMDPRQTGFDGGRYPFPRIYTMGINFGF